MSTTKAILVAGGVAVGAYLLLEALKPRTVTTGSSSSSGGDYALFAGLANFGSHVVDSISKSPPSSPQPTPVYVTGQGYVSGGSSAPIDPTTGGVWLPTGDTYGPRPPS